METPPQQPRYIRPADVYAVYGITHRQVRRWLHEGVLVARKPRGLRGPAFMRCADIDDLLESSVKSQPSKKKRAKRA
jgi:hypothetical protein